MALRYEYLIRLYQTRLLRGSVDVRVEADSAVAAARIALAAAAGDPDDETEERSYRLPDGRTFHLDPEDEVVDDDIWAEIIVDGLIARTVDRPIRLDLDNDQALALSILLRRAILGCPDERVASLYDSMTQTLPDPPALYGVLPSLRVAIPITAQEDSIVDGSGILRTANSPPVVVAVLHDGSDAAFEQALGLVGSLGIAIAIADCGAS